MMNSIESMIMVANKEIEKRITEIDNGQISYDDELLNYLYYTRAKLIEEYNFTHRDKGIRWGDGQKPF